MNQTALNQIATIILRLLSVGYFAGIFYDLLSLPSEVYGFGSWHDGYHKNLYTLFVVENGTKALFNLAMGVVLFRYAKPWASFFTRGLQEHTNHENEEGVWPPAPRRPASE